MNFEYVLNQKKQMIDQYIEQYLPSTDKNINIIERAIRYSVLSGGKRLRPILMISTYELFANDLMTIMPLACSIEYIHCYSLIHDDLPCMDDDDYRRGKFTNHKVFGEAIALLAGDALLNHAFETMLSSIKKENMHNYINAVRQIISASGLNGMIAGQVADILYESKPISEEQLNYINKNKTGALIRASVIAGAIMGNADSKQKAALDKYAENIGIAFQIKDDILDIIGDQAVMGKRTGSDVKNGKFTYPSIYGIQQANKKLDDLIDEAVECLSIFGESSQFLKQLAIYIKDRRN